jgi:hypothetical protein
MGLPCLTVFAALAYTPAGGSTLGGWRWLVDERGRSTAAATDF